jgi:hypothetical protein
MAGLERNVIPLEFFSEACKWLLGQKRPGLDVFTISKKTGGYEFAEATFTRGGPAPTGTARFKNKVVAISFEEQEDPPGVYAEIKLFTGTRTAPPVNGRVLRPNVPDYFKILAEGIAKRGRSSRDAEAKIGEAFLKSPVYPEAERVFNGFVDALNPPASVETMHTISGWDERRRKLSAKPSLEEEIALAAVFLKETGKRSPKPKLRSRIYGVETMHEISAWDD